MDQDYYCESVLSGQVPVRIVAETDSALAFHHVFQTWDTHIVVIPKRHVRSLDELDDDRLLTEVFRMVIHVIKDLGLAGSNYKVITNGGAYQSNKHLHVHIVSGKPLDPLHPAAKGELAV